ncbi:MAG: sulfurtransferase [Gammaproteobacteria bacterium]|nr:sulfurtransferase [Gammaproteobacteria bacterium]
MPSPNEITVTQLSRLIGTPDYPTIIDVRSDEDFDDDPRMLPGSIRHPFAKIETLSSSLAKILDTNPAGRFGSAFQSSHKRIVLYCQKGKKISQGAMAHLRSLDVPTESLEGGQFGWRDANQPMIPADKLLHLSDPMPLQRSLWVTRYRPKIDRIACPWLIRRFIDPGARFLYVAPAEVMGVAEKYNALPFDVEGVFWTHRCTFDTLIEEFDLNLKPLLHLAEIVRGADTDHHDLTPESAGLLAASLGLSRMYRDDWDQLEASMTLYDAFYRWCRDATNEGHDWPMHKISSR